MAKKQAQNQQAHYQQSPSNFNTRLRIAEEKATNLNRKIELIESNFIEHTKKQNETIRALDKDVLELKRRLDSMQQKIELIIRELKLTAGKDEIQSIKKYLDIWDFGRFVTRKEIHKLIDEKLEDMEE